MKGRIPTKKKLKFFRILFASFVLTCFLLVFLGSEKFTQALADKLLFLQFTPSAVKFFLAAGGIASFGFLFILLLTILFGRVYCSFLCPLGILQDIVIFIRRKFGGKNEDRGYRRKPGWMRYFILTAVALSVVPGTASLIKLLDPYSIFGRVAAVFFKPVSAGGRNLLAGLLERFEIYWLWHQSIPPISVGMFVVTFVFFAAIVVLAIRRGRLYCNTICPVGTLLGIVSRWSLLKVQVRQDMCVSCGKCEKICRAECIDIANKRIDTSRCVGCFDCMAVCPESAVGYLHSIEKRPKELINHSRRRLIAGSVLSGGVLALAPALVRAAIKNNNQDNRQHPVMPPGAVDRERFCDGCIGCGLCVSICPEKVIKQSFLEYGLAGLMVPVLDYRNGYCDYECNLCGLVCPSGAIKKLKLAEKQRVQIGQVRLLKDRCIVHTRHEDCGACAEACPRRAVYTVERNNVRYPEINAELCIGCGVCQNMCPVMPKAIIVDGVAVQGRAKKPFYDAKPAPDAKPEDIDESFPF